MEKLIPNLLLLFSIFLLLHSVQSQDSKLCNSTGEQVDNEYLVLLKNAATDEVSQIEEYLTEDPSVGRIIKTLKFGTMQILHIYAQDNIAEGLSSQAAVDIIEPNMELSLCDWTEEMNENENSSEESKAQSQARSDSQTCVYQNTNSTLWGLTRISSKDKPDYNNGKYYYNKNDGEGVQVYVVDTGIYIGHADFEGRAVRGYTARDVKETEGEEDLHGHGTHCAGTIGSRSYGVAKQAKLVAVKVMNKNGSSQRDDLLDGLAWALNDFTKNKPKAVLSMSLGGFSEIFDEAVNRCIEAGLPIVVAAGNEEEDACEGSPARVPDAITVGATDISDEMAWFSNYGSCVDILAPGVKVISTGIGSDHATATMSGTSMACPHVSGTIAKMLSNVDTMPTPEEVKSYLLGDATRDKIDVKGKPQTPNLLLYTGCYKDLVIAAEDNGAQGRGSFTRTTVFISIMLVLVFMP